MESAGAPLDPELPRPVRDAFEGAFALLSAKLGVQTRETPTWGALARALERLAALASNAHRAHTNQALSLEDMADEGLDCLIFDPALAHTLTMARERGQPLPLSPAFFEEAGRAYKREKLEARQRELRQHLAYFNHLTAE